MKYVIKDKNNNTLGYIDANSSDEAKAEAILSYGDAVWTAEESNEVPRNERIGREA